VVRGWLCVSLGVARGWSDGGSVMVQGGSMVVQGWLGDGLGWLGSGLGVSR
jgi:hypothetical protein